MTTDDFNPFAGGELLRVSPTTGPQKEVIASAQMSDEANTSFNEAISITIAGHLNRDLLEVCFKKLIERHDIFRATFSRKGGEICLQENPPFELDFEDLSHLEEHAQEKAINDLWKNISISPMNLEEGPLLFAWLKQISDIKHEIIIAAHHIICDGWTFGIILYELSQLYRNQGRTNGLPAAESFFDFAEEIDAKEIANSDGDYWREKFKQLPPVLDLPLDNLRPPARTFQARRYDYQLDNNLVAQLPQTAASLKASLVNLVMAGYFALLHRLTGSEDIVVGLPVAGQSALNRLNQAGHMVQLLPIRLTFDGDTTFSELVGKVKSEVLNASEHPNFTFGKLLENLVIDRSRVPLISTIFNIDQAMGDIDFGDAVGTLRTVPRAAENFEMFLNVLPSADELTIETTYSTALFSESTITAWMQSLETILSEVTIEPNKTISSFGLARSVPEVLQKSNKTGVDIIHPDFVRAFSKQVQSSPDAVAVICSDKRYSYQELDLRSNAIAKILAGHGIKEADVVGLCCERSEQMLACILAIFKLGAAYLPLDPDFPQDRLTYMLEDSGAAAVIEDNAAPAGVLDAPVTHFRIDDLENPDSANESIEPPAEKPERLAYIIYTSGSTGKPKGVRVQNLAMINFLESMAREPGCTKEDRLLAVTTLSFDISVLELYMPLICGATTIIATREQVKDGEKLAELIEQHDVTQLQATPSTWRMLLASKWRDQKPNLVKLKALCGGEPLPPDLVKDLVGHVAELWNMFGPTETTVWSTCKLITSPEGLITVGKPIANTQVYILDQQLSPLPLSAPGELFIGGDGVTLGYHNRDELNSERFLDHPTFGRIYSTGDLAKLLPNGEIQHLGRLDDQVKLRGYRIELGEIESALLACEGIEAAAVYLWELSPVDVRIVACCVPASVGKFETRTVRKKLRNTLPNYMVPQYLMTVEQIPLTPNGKINRRALPRPEISKSTVLSGASLDSDTEKMVAQIWTELIKPKNPIGRDDNFFEIGGHSLLALQAIRKIEDSTGTRLTPAEIVTERLSSLATKIIESTNDNSIENTGPIALPSNETRGLSPEQSRILKRQLDWPKTTCNNLPASWLIEGNLNLSTFEKSLERVFERQTALRTIIQNNQNGYCQFLQHIKKLNILDYEDYTGAEDSLDKALEKARDLSVRPFAVLNNQLCRTKLIKLSKDKHLFVFIPHQLIFDGWSFDVFLNELESTYKALSEERPPSLTRLPFEYRDFSNWSRTRTLDSQLLDYHQPSIDAFPAIRFSDSKLEKGQCKRIEYVFTLEDLKGIESFCQKHKFRLHEFLFAAFSKSLSNVLNKTNIVLGVPVSGRSNSDVIGLIGCFFTILPFEITIENDSFFNASKSIVVQLKEFLKHQDISFAEIVENTQKKEQPFPDFMAASFAFQDIRNRPTKMADLKLSQIDMPRNQTEIPIEFWTRIQPDGFMSVFDYDSSMVPLQIIEKIATEMEHIYKNIDQIESNSDRKNDQNNIDKSTKKTIWRRLFK